MSFHERIFGSSDGLPDPSNLTADDIERLERHRGQRGRHG